MREIFTKIPTTNPKHTPEEFKKKFRICLKDIGGEWYVKTMCNPPPPLKMSCLSQNQKE